MGACHCFLNVVMENTGRLSGETRTVIRWKVSPGHGADQPSKPPSAEQSMSTVTVNWKGMLML